MATYKRPQSAVNRVLAPLPSGRRAAARLRLDIADLLTGPTSGHNADNLAGSLLAANSPHEIVATLRAIAARFEAYEGGR